MKEDKFLALVTLEEQNIYIHLYDVKKNELVKIEKVGEIPESVEITHFEIISQGDYILGNYEYIDEDDTETRNSIKVVGSVYHVTENNEIKSVLENEYYTKLVDEIGENYYTQPEDMIYINDKLHLLFRNYSHNNNYQDGERENSVALLTIDEDEILYFGIIRNSMIEDYTVSDVKYAQYTMNNEGLIIRNRTRNISTVSFAK